MKKIIFIANNNVGDGFSGGDRIFVEFIKNWSDKAEIVVFGSEEAIKISKDRGAEAEFIETDMKNLSMPGGLVDFLKHIVLRTRKGLSSIRENESLVKDANYVYSVSDFYPDFIPALWIKKKYPEVKWIAGYYLFAPKSFSKDSTYKGWQSIKGFFYWFTQIFSHLLIKRFADYVFVTNEPDRKRFICKRLSEGRVIAIRGGVDIDMADSVPEDCEKKYDAVFIGRFHSTKGVLELIDAWKIVCEKKTGAKLALIGVGGLEQEMRDRVKEYSLEDKVDFLGFVDGIEKYKIFKKCRISLYPATLDHWSMAPVEAMAAGLPLVAFDVGTLKYLNPAGMVRVPCYDVEKYATGILDLLGNGSLYQEMKIEAIRWAKTWDWKVRSQEVYDILSKGNING